MTVLHRDFECDCLDTLGLTGLQALPCDSCAQPYLPGGSVHCLCLYSVAACTKPHTSCSFPSVFCNSRYQRMAWKLVFDGPTYVLLCHDKKMDDFFYIDFLCFDSELNKLVIWWLWLAFCTGVDKIQCVIHPEVTLCGSHYNHRTLKSKN